MRTTDASHYLSLISVYGRKRADELKFLNRRTYQDLIFEGLGLTEARKAARTTCSTAA